MRAKVVSCSDSDGERPGPKAGGGTRRNSASSSTETTPSCGRSRGRGRAGGAAHVAAAGHGRGGGVVVVAEHTGERRPIDPLGLLAAHRAVAVEVEIRVELADPFAPGLVQGQAVDLDVEPHQDGIPAAQEEEVLHVAGRRRRATASAPGAGLAELRDPRARDGDDQPRAGASINGPGGLQVVSRADATTPHPDPPPQGGREEEGLRRRGFPLPPPLWGRVGVGGSRERPGDFAIHLSQRQGHARGGEAEQAADPPPRRVARRGRRPAHWKDRWTASRRYQSINGSAGTRGCSAAPRTRPRGPCAGPRSRAAAFHVGDHPGRLRRASAAGSGWRGTGSRPGPRCRGTAPRRRPPASRRSRRWVAPATSRPFIRARACRIDVCASVGFSSWRANFSRNSPRGEFAAPKNRLGALLLGRQADRLGQAVVELLGGQPAHPHPREEARVVRARCRRPVAASADACW